MKYQANPVVVEARRIETVLPAMPSGHMGLVLEAIEGDTDDNENFCLATPGMTSRMTPVAGDYVVTQEDGYIYLNPKDVFERKYSPVQA